MGGNSGGTSVYKWLCGGLATMVLLLASAGVNSVLADVRENKKPNPVTAQKLKTYERELDLLKMGQQNIMSAQAVMQTSLEGIAAKLEAK